MALWFKLPCGTRGMSWEWRAHCPRLSWVENSKAGSELTLGMLRSSVQVWMEGLSLLFPALHHESSEDPAARVKSGQL